jgi:hypothetical protein
MRLAPKMTIGAMLSNATKDGAMWESFPMNGAPTNDDAFQAKCELEFCTLDVIQNSHE